MGDPLLEIELTMLRREIRRERAVSLMATLASVAALVGPGLAFDMSDPDMSLHPEKEPTHGDRERLRLAQEKRERKARRAQSLPKKTKSRSKL